MSCCLSVHANNKSIVICRNWHKTPPSCERTPLPMSAREKFTTRHACKGPQSTKIGQDSNPAIAVGRVDAGPSDQTDRSQKRHPLEVGRSMHHIGSEEPVSPCQLVEASHYQQLQTVRCSIQGTQPGANCLNYNCMRYSP